MATALAWHNVESFKEHVERMRRFRRSHPVDRQYREASLKSLPTPCIIGPAGEAEGHGLFAREDWPALIPLAQASLHRFWRN